MLGRGLELPQFLLHHRQRIDGSAAWPSQTKVSNKRPDSHHRTAQPPIAARYSIVAIGDESTRPRQTLTAIVKGNLLDASTDQASIDFQRSAVLTQHLKGSGVVPQDERTLRSLGQCSALALESPSIILLLVVREAESGEQPVILRIRPQFRSNSAPRGRHFSASISLSIFEAILGDERSRLALIYRPHHTGFRFSRNAPMPSCASIAVAFWLITSLVYS